MSTNTTPAADSIGAARDDDNTKCSNAEPQQQSPTRDCQCLPGAANALSDGIRRAWTEWRRHEEAKNGHRASGPPFVPLDEGLESSEHDVFHDSVMFCDDCDILDDLRDADDGNVESNGTNLHDSGFYIVDDDDDEGEEGMEDARVQLAEEPVSHLDHCPYILSPTMMKQIRDDGLPSTQRDKRWVRLYSLLRDGDAFGTFLRRVKGHNDTLFVVRTSRDEIVGGYADAAWAKLTTAQDGSTFYGTGKAFLFSVGEDGSPPRKKTTSVRRRPSFLKYSSDNLLEAFEASEEGPSDNGANGIHDTEEETPTSTPSTPKSSAIIPGSERVNLHKWQGINHYNQLCHTTEGKIAMGGGGEDASFGICIQDHFHHGTSGPCDTFGMAKPLTSRSHFDVVDFEVYGFMYAW